jgi:hypothetical protein
MMRATHSQLMMDRLGLHGLGSGGATEACFDGIVETECYTKVMAFREGHFHVRWVMIALP